MRKGILFVAVVALAILTISGVALAKAEYQGSLTGGYPALKGSKLDSCNVCHKADFSLNGYGSDFGAANHSFTAIESKDSDGDGFSNIAEINAKTLPGDASSKPAGSSGSNSGGSSGNGGSTPPAPPVDKSKKFWDLDGHWGQSVGLKAATLGIFKGRPDNSFGPDDKVTRGELATIVLRAFNLPEGGGAAYKDVSKSDWFAAGVAGAQKLIPGYADGTFRPNTAADRQTTVVAIVRAAGLEGSAVQMDPNDVSAILSGFSDAKSVAADKAPFLAYAVRSGMIKGNSDKTLTPAGTLTRAQLAQIFVNLYTNDNSLTSLANNYVGSETCKTCHAQKYADWKGTAHSKMIQDPKAPGAIVGDFATNTKFAVDKVALVVAGQMTQQRYLEKRGDEYWYLPATWNLETKTWTDNAASKWSGACTSCHVVGYTAATKTWFENGVSCEACHGAGSKHIAFGGDKTKIKSTNGFEMCAKCHSGQVADLNKTGHPGFFKSQVDAVGGHYGDNCIKCHSATVIVANYNGKTAPKLADFKTGDLKNDRTGITCVVCHDPHKRTNEAQLRLKVEDACTVCHTADLTTDTFKAGSDAHHPTKEMFKGIGALGVPKTPSPKVATCADCHMADGSHAFVPGTPTVTIATKHGPLDVDVCAKCHTSMTKEKVEEFKQSIEDQMAEVQALLAQAKTKLDAAKAAGTTIDPSVELLYKQAYTNNSFMVADKSNGFHNPPYYQAILKASKAMLEDFLSKVK
ncbi:MAG TPA: ammonia-forming cytochrome c nitrite reductase subunit c552 [Bacillota bacterium]